jgi:two-component system CheB/CheR fusion protein
MDFSVRPAPLVKSQQNALLVTFEEQQTQPASKTVNALADTEDSLVKQLENELKVTREELQSNLEEQETTNEELKAANEEVTSVNEELQSTNEELETAKEELQSMNEELTTVNSQLQDKVNELTGTNSDLANLLRSTDIATLFLDPQLCIKRFTPASRALFKLIATDVGRPLSDITAIVNDNSLLSDAEQVLTKLTPLEKEVHTADNACYLRRVLPYRTQDERIDGVVVTYVDITERRRGQEGLRQLATVMRDSNDAITVQGFDGKILAWNRGAERMYGWSEKEALALNAFDVIPTEKHAEAVDYLKRLQNGETVKSFETQRLTKDGRTLDVWLTATALPNEKNQPNAMATTERDISEYKHNQATLIAVKEAAEQANTAKSRFLAAASHDLRQPLQTIETLQAILAQKVADPALQKVIRDLGHTLHSMGSMLNVLLDINQLEVGTVSPRLRSVPIQQILTLLATDFQHLAQQKDLQLRIRACTAFIYSDPDLLQQILRNLVANAIKYTEKVKVLVGCRRRGDTLRIEVRDTGAGIPKDHFRDIFEEFYQLTNPARDRRRGLGLGLAIVQRLSYLLKHPVNVQSTPGQGSLFMVTVPLSSETSQPGVEKIPQPSSKSDTGPISILFIEDDVALLRAAELFLKLQDFLITPAATSFDALRAIEEDQLRPDLVISDYRLPCGDTGVEVVQRIRHMLGYPLPAIIMTGDTTGGWAEQARQHGYHILQKPVPSDLLMQTIQEQLAKRDASPYGNRY